MLKQNNQTEPRQVVGPRGKIIFLNDHSNKMAFKDILLYPQVSTSLCPHQRSFFLEQNGNQYRDSQNNMQIVREFDTLRHKQNIFINPPSQGSEIYVEEKAERVEEPELVDDLPETTSSKDDAHIINSWITGEHVQALYKFKLDKIPALRRRSGHRFHPQPRNYL